MNGSRVPVVMTLWPSSRRDPSPRCMWQWVSGGRLVERQLTMTELSAAEVAKLERQHDAAAAAAAAAASSFLQVKRCAGLRITGFPIGFGDHWEAGGMAIRYRLYMDKGNVSAPCFSAISGCRHTCAVYPL